MRFSDPHQLYIHIISFIILSSWQQAKCFILSQHSTLIWKIIHSLWWPSPSAALIWCHILILGKEFKTQECQVNTWAGRRWPNCFENVGWRYSFHSSILSYYYTLMMMKVMIVHQRTALLNTWDHVTKCKRIMKCWQWYEDVEK